MSYPLDSGIHVGGVRCCLDVSRGFEMLFVIRFSLVLVLCAWVVVGLTCVFGTVFSWRGKGGGGGAYFYQIYTLCSGVIFRSRRGVHSVWVCVAGRVFPRKGNVERACFFCELLRLYLPFVVYLCGLCIVPLWWWGFLLCP
jgi:hypothetical protein